MFRSLTGHFFKTSRPTLDNFVFRLHYRVTVGLLIACAAALLWKINYGNPISCSSSYERNTEFLNDHCWYDGTYTIPSSRSKKAGIEVPYPGIDVGPEIATDKEYHNTHRWVVIAVLVQALVSYIPRLIWKCVEGRLIQRWTWNMNGSRKTANVDKLRKEEIANYLKNRSSRNIIYTIGHLYCELHNLTNTAAQLFFVSYVLQMSTPSARLLIESRIERFDDSALSSFPLLTKCELFKFGSSGDVQKHDFMCVMTINAFMESIFIYQWVWFVLLSVLSFVAFVYHVVILVLPPLRVLRLSSKACFTNRSTLDKVVGRLGMGEWFVLYMLSKNLDPIDTRDILKSLADDINGKEQLYPLAELVS